MKVVLIEPMGISPIKLKSFSDLLANKNIHFKSYSDRNEFSGEIAERLKDAEVAILSNIALPNEIIEKCPRLKMISVGFTGVDHICMKACKERGIVVSNAAGYSTTAVSELTIGLIIDSLRKITEMHQTNSKGGSRGNFLGEELKDKTVGIIGTGAIGSRVAELLLNFGCKVLAYSRTEKENLINKGVIYSKFEVVISKSDIISLHLPLTNETNCLFSKEVIFNMKKGSYLINTARGKIVDNLALSEALINGHLSGAAVDIYEYEPPLNSDYPLLNVPNIIHTPHIAFATKQSFDKRADFVFENVVRWLEGQPRNVCK